MLNLAILISGRGSNMDAILKALKERKIAGVSPRVVISDKPDAPGLRIASEKYNVPVQVLAANGLRGWEYDSKLVTLLEKFGVTEQSGLICLAGFMRLLSPEFVSRYPMRILNIHPALLPAFPGLHAQRQTIEYGAKVSGCTVHFVDRGTDTGPVIIQQALQVNESDNEESLSARILELEHDAYPKAVQLFADGKLKVNGRRVLVQP